jgi:flagellar biosynthesis/type III secretory pathway protein FliH
MKNKPLRELKEEFQRISELADMASLSEKERRYYQCEEKCLRDYINTVESSVRERVEEGLRNGLKEWREAGLKEGIAKGREEGREAGLKEGISKGREEGKKEGREEGKKEGREEGKKSIAKSFKESGVSIDIISKSTGLTIEEINNL